MQNDISDIDDKYYELLLKTFRKVQKIVADRRRLLGDNQSQIAARINMNDGQLSRLLSGRSNVTLRTLNRIARAADARLQIDVVPLDMVPKANVPSSSADRKAWDTYTTSISNPSLFEESIVVTGSNTPYINGSVVTNAIKGDDAHVR